MAIQTMVIDPNGTSYTDDEIVDKVNAASAQITRAASVAAAARPIGSKEVVAANIADNTVTNSQIAAGVAKTNLDAISDTERGYVKTNPTTGQFKVIGVQRDADGKLTVSYDDTVV